MRKEVLGWMVDCATRCIELERDNQSAIDSELHKIVCMTRGVPFKNNRKTDLKNPTCSNSSPNRKKLMTPINKILQVKPRIVRYKYFPTEKPAFRDWRTLLKEAAREPTTEKELVTGDPEFLGWVYASGEGVGGGWLTGRYALEPKIWRLGWPKKLRARLITLTNPGGDLDINDLEMAGKLLSWPVLEGIVGTENLCFKHVGLFSDNTAVVLWTQRGASKSLQQQDV